MTGWEFTRSCDYHRGACWRYLPGHEGIHAMELSVSNRTKKVVLLDFGVFYDYAPSFPDIVISAAHASASSK